ncbi:Nitrous oxide reductase maturation protein, outer-membrane lipoprotein NosL [hydrothermal vent metagenome]|uniref:Nitrous oxide reductase maturation protein, outer-membrane lipoprotein NosL n=1 Tax=hydrothermal vent metagenome TaxID=652676 RepID=A0A1W1BH31_9ZZZZ
MKKILITILLLTAVASATADSNKTWHTKPMEPKYTINYDKNTTCLVRKIALYKDPKWVSKIEVRNGKIVYFCSPKSMFEFYFRPGKWFDIGVKSERDFSKIVVTDYGSLKAINAEKAYFVYGSRAISPAGDDLVPFASKDDAKAFANKYNGKRVMKFDEIKDALIRLLNGRI